MKIYTIYETLNFTKKENINLTIVGSEEMLVYKIAKKFEENELEIFGLTSFLSFILKNSYIINITIFFNKSNLLL
ncbi:hypothetical protein [uncultured Brachyspira sp.]|uniref:hypothetical protein n=1 Tax=uncultured Brachyspira sp. TaxID=221953 RepID=UPI002613AD25|nr:hypothetical protein [uncultured Brachyspira sp.]